MAKRNSSLKVSGIPKFLRDGGPVDVQWFRESRIITIDLAAGSVDERLISHDLMKEHQPCIALVRVQRTGYIRPDRGQRPWPIEYYAGGAAQDKTHLTTVGLTCWELMRASLPS